MFDGDKKKNVEQTEYFAEQMSKGNLDAIDEVFAPDFVDHDPAADQGEGAEGLRDFWKAFLGAFPDLKITGEQVVADEDKVAVAYTATGTHQGDFLGHPATGKRVSARGLQIARFEDGKVVERWGMSDQLGMLQQIGAVPQPV